ncbi:chloride channel protein [Amaricoccus solimangrovi]|uniref:Chloride channel protein n=1 Tax=Amaricoccus solimangrovi TaxID=2589815 RepID=A0A501WCL8_9RHOB|nr:chloride channel protein [Amaricoccus solimangrovi]TPE44587.1 chloride channel protein [Amaricoccus solimangrovi]
MPFRSSSARLGDHSADRRVILLCAMALLVGTGGAAGAWILLHLIDLVTNLLWFGRLSSAPAEITDALLGPAGFAIPVLGALVIGLMARFGSDKIRGHGIPEAMEIILHGQSRLSPKVAVLKPLSAAISIGSGGPFGAEGPIIMTGGAIGSLFAQCFHLSAAERKTLLVAGAAAGMTAIFGTPLAAVLLAVEVLLFEWKPRSLLPVTAAVLVSLGWRAGWLGTAPLFPAAGVIPAGPWVMPGAAVLGLVIGLTASAMAALLYRIEDAFHRLPLHWMWWPAVGAVFVGLGGLLDPRVLGAGYGNITDLLSGAPAGSAVLALLALKAAIWLIALGSGTSGGVLAPMLIIGGALGWLGGPILPGDGDFWAMIGMAAIMSGGMRAPLTGVLFAAEVTGRFDAMPVMIAGAAAAYGLTVLISPRSILTEKIARRGHHLSQELAVDPLDVIRVEEMMTGEPATLSGARTLAETADFLSGRATHRAYPVVDPDGHLLGLVSRDDALSWRRDEGDPNATLADTLADREQRFVFTDAPCAAAADLMLRSGAWRLPVLSRDTGSVVGIITRHDLLRVRLRRRREETERSASPIWRGAPRVGG